MNDDSSTTGLQLPYEQVKAPGTGGPVACYPLERFAAASDEQLIASFAAQLARYSRQTSIPLLLAHGSSAARAIIPLTIEIDPTSASEALAQQVGLLLQSAMATPGGTPANAASPAALVLVEGPPVDAPREWLARFEAAALRDRGVDLCLLIARQDGVCGAAFVYDAAVLSAAAVARFAGHFRNILAAMAARPEQAIGDIAILTEEDRRILTESGTGPCRARSCTPLHRLIEGHAQARPQAIAVRFKDQVLTYRELNRRSNQLAHYLAGWGIGAESRVVVCVEPSLSISIALLGILKAGAVYVPLDPTYPKARIEAILKDTSPALLIAQPHLIERHSLQGFAILALEDDGAALAGLDDADSDLEVRPEQAAYVYYTSGTTGQPKGVVATHGNLIHYILVAQRRYGFADTDVMPAIARFSFSISMFELLSPLVAGATSLILTREHVVDLTRMARTFQEITFFHAGPSLLKNLLAHIRAQFASFEPFAGVRHASSGGDMVAPEVLESLKEIFRNAEVFVIYGCSEVSCMGVTYQAPRDRPLTRTYVGRPFENVTVRVLDASRRPVPLGVVGEICFAGEGIVRGYLHRPELTAEKFVDVAGQRFYCTGDMGRFGNAGELEILGRRDFQIQLRGMRIELGDVEYALRRAPGVRDGVAVTRQAPNGEKILVAYVVLDAQPQPGSGKANSWASTVRRHMLDHLPDYMVPAAYVELASLPLNLNMKVDRNALPDPPAAQRAMESFAPRAPQTPTQRRLARIWQETLGLEGVGLDDNFIELGGDSIRGSELILAVQRELGVVVDGMEVLRETLEVMAELCDQRRGAGGSSSPASGAALSLKAPDEVMETFYFGRNADLYGVLHRPAAGAITDALLVASPMGQESIRCHFILQRLARLLAARGIAVLRFDYFGCGDSLGQGHEASCERWRTDIADAGAELSRRAGMAVIAALGVRIGATLLAHTMANLRLSRLVLWDPVVSGAEYLKEIGAMQRERLKALQSDRLGRKPRKVPGRQELLGFIYSQRLLGELARLDLETPSLAASGIVRCLLSAGEAQRVAGAVNGSFATVSVDGDCNWTDAAYLEDVIADTGFAKALAGMLEEGTT